MTTDRTNTYPRIGEWHERTRPISLLVFHHPVADSSRLSKEALMRILVDSGQTNGHPYAQYHSSISYAVDGEVSEERVLNDDKYRIAGTKGFNNIAKSICVDGDFASRYYSGPQKGPTAQQMARIYKTIRRDRERYNIPRDGVVCHVDVDPIRKPFCPGDELHEALMSYRFPSTRWVTDVQYVINSLTGAALYCDGKIGPTTKRAVEAFQRTWNTGYYHPHNRGQTCPRTPLAVDGVPGNNTKSALMMSVRGGAE